ncbi:hypothetical protein RI129_010835 [Pyrocoelia pectoralis]|uniref:DUF4371 domain-containing protein n=1 Tax=Pyrocoelia pectoralis TaxID=417401 RepID=A0AAN7VAV5_9COLE
MVDEARCYKQEQLSVAIRYTVGLEVEERFLGFVDCSSSRDAESLKILIKKYLSKCSLLNNAILIGQSYDGASVMSGKHQGLQAKIREDHPHCLAHRMNLVIVDSCAKVSTAAAFFNTLEAIYVHFLNPVITLIS